MIDTLDPEFEKIYSERKDIILCCVECGDTGFQLGREFEKSKIEQIEQENARLHKLVRECLEYSLARIEYPYERCKELIAIVEKADAIKQGKEE